MQTKQRLHILQTLREKEVYSLVDKIYVSEA
jgi:hypothetical protein